jgi:hypothetical protein
MSQLIIPPIQAEVTKANKVTGFHYEDSVLVIRVEPVRREAYDVSDTDEPVCPTSFRRHTFRVQELGLPWLKVEYEVTHLTFSYVNRYKNKSTFTLEVVGIDSKLKVSQAVLSTGMQMLVVQNLPLEVVQDLLRHNHRVQTSVSALDRWKQREASKLPTQGKILRRMQRRTPSRELHVDEYKSNGMWSVVFRDEHDRILLVRKMKRRTEEKFAAIFRYFRILGLRIRVVYVDFWKAYPGAIRRIFPQAILQYDYFHVIQNIFRHLYKALVAYRKHFKAQQVQDQVLHDHLATKLWKNRYKLLKNRENLTEEEKKVVDELLAEHQDTILEKIVLFKDKIRDIFNTTSAYYANMARLELTFKGWENIATCFRKCINFLNKHFKHMISYLQYTGVQRNSLQETTIRSVKRVDHAKCGFRSEKGLENHWKLYQVMVYL